jgi:chorismate mutase-like protein
MSRDVDVSRDPVRALAKCRERIDAVDLRILDLLNERTLIVEEIGRIKREAQMPIYEPKREDAVFQNVIGHNGGPLPADAVKRVFERIVDEMRKVQKTLIENNTAAPDGRRGD